MNRRTERRTEPRTEVEAFYSTELILPNVTTIYQFRIWNLSSRGMCILVKNDSGILAHLKVGTVLEMKYNPADRSTPPKQFRTEIRHITQDEEGRFKDHSLVGLQILEVI